MRDILRAILVLSALALLAGCTPKRAAINGGPSPAAGTKAPSGKRVSVYLLPKKKGLSYFSSCADGAKRAAEELGDWTLCTTADGRSPEKAAALIEQWTLKKADVIAVSPNDPQVLAPAMRRRGRRASTSLPGTPTGTPDTRELFVNQATAEQIGQCPRGHRWPRTSAARTDGQGRHHHRDPDGGEPERVDKVHEGAAEKVSQAGAPPRQAVERGPEVAFEVART